MSSSTKSKLGSTLVLSAAATGVMFLVPNIAEASFGSSTLRQGMENSEVKELQERLRAEGHFKFHTSTGYFGDITVQAVRDFQRANNLTVDGIVGPQTFSVLSGTKVSASNASSKNSGSTSQPKQSSSSSSSNTTITEISNTGQVMRVGTKNNDVSRLQAYLSKAGFLSGSDSSGYYGNATRDAVRKFQQARNLTVDGLAGPQTLGAVNKEIKNTTTTAKTSSSNTSKTSNSSTKTNSNTSSTVSLSNVFLRQGSSGAQVTALQTKLKDLGYFTATVNGSYNQATVDAVKKLQTQTNITVDGIFGPQTNGELNKNIKYKAPVSSSTPKSGSGSTNSSVLKEGQRNSKVTELQDMLKAIGHFTSNSTGYFGPVTKESVIKFQQQWGLTADGLVTTSTWDKITEVAAVHMGSSNSNGGGTTSEFNVMNLIADASNYLGVPYLWGGTTAAGFDCSGFVQFIFRNNGVNVPRTVAEQWRAGKTVSGNLQVGDVVYFATTSSAPSHNGIYIGNNNFIHSGSSTGVTITSMSSNYWSTRYLGAKRP